MTTPFDKSRYQGVIAHIPVSNAREAAQFYVKAFAAEITDERPTEDGRLIHCELLINGGAFMISDLFPEYGTGQAGAAGAVMHICSNDVRDWWDRAKAAGMEVTHDLHVAFWGDLYGQMKDAFGVTWAFVGPNR